MIKFEPEYCTLHYIIFWHIDIWGCLCNKLISSFLSHLSLNWCTFFKQVTAHWWHQWAKIKKSRDQEITDIRLLRELYDKDKNNTFQTALYQKPTCLQSYLHSHSNHLKSLKKKAYFKAKRWGSKPSVPH